MQKFKVFIAPILIFSIALGLSTACGFFDDFDLHDSAVTRDATTFQGTAIAHDSGSSSDETTDLLLNMVPLTRAPAIPVVIIPEASGTLIEYNSKALIDHSNTVDGYVMVRWFAESKMQLRVQVSGPGESTYTYTIFPTNTYEVFPLSDGNGIYTINVFEQVTGDRYALVLGLTIDVTLNDEFAPFLRPNQYVNFNEKSDIVIKAAQLVSDDMGFIEKIASVYSFVINNTTYDTGFAEAVQRGEHKGYLPDLDAVLASGKGICFDFAALMTGMLRSQGIPTKLVVGYATDIRHAWINVYSEETGWIENVIFFDGESWMMMDPTFASAASSAAALQSFIGDGSSYSMTHLY